MTEFRKFKPHDGGPCPYGPDEMVDVQFADDKVQYGVRAGFHGSRWSRDFPNFMYQITGHRPADNRFQGEGLERD